MFGYSLCGCWSFESRLQDSGWILDSGFWLMCAVFIHSSIQKHQMLVVRMQYCWYSMSQDRSAPQLWPLAFGLWPFFGHNDSSKALQRPPPPPPPSPTTPTTTNNHHRLLRLLLGALCCVVLCSVVGRLDLARSATLDNSRGWRCW